MKISALSLGTGVLAGAVLVTMVAASANAKPPSPASAAAAYTVAAATNSIAYPDNNVILAPLSGVSPAVSKIDVASAHQIAANATYLPAATDQAGPGTANLMAYTNTAAGQIQPDGSVTLEYRGEPAWVFTFPLAHFVNPGLAGAARADGTSPASRPARSECSWVSIVDARTSEFIEAFETCKK